MAALLAAIGARLLLWDRRVSFVAINALLPFALVPAFAVLVLALWLRRVPLVVVAFDRFDVSRDTPT